MTCPVNGRQERKSDGIGIDAVHMNVHELPDFLFDPGLVDAGGNIENRRKHLPGRMFKHPLLSRDGFQFRSRIDSDSDIEKNNVPRTYFASREPQRFPDRICRFSGAAEKKYPCTGNAMSPCDLGCTMYLAACKAFPSPLSTGSDALSTVTPCR
jgi:hypothetical protein